jgi:hypothetical protein
MRAFGLRLLPLGIWVFNAQASILQRAQFAQFRL